MSGPNPEPVSAELPQPGRYSVIPKGPSRPGARYAVLDYAHDPAARHAAQHYANLALQPNHVLAGELKAALAGGEPGPTLRTHEVIDLLELPGARLLVLDYVHDYPARVALWSYADRADAELAGRVIAELKDAEADFAEHMRSRNLPDKPSRKKRGRR